MQCFCFCLFYGNIESSFLQSSIRVGLTCTGLCLGCWTLTGMWIPSVALLGSRLQLTWCGGRMLENEASTALPACEMWLVTCRAETVCLPFRSLIILLVPLLFSIGLPVVHTAFCGKFSSLKRQGFASSTRLQHLESIPIMTRLMYHAYVQEAKHSPTVIHWCRHGTSTMHLPGLS